MPNTASAKKDLRQSKVRAERNKIVKAEIKSLRIKLRKMIDAKKAKEADDVAKLLGQKLDKAHKKNVLKKNTVARIKSRFMAKMNAMKKENA